MGRKRDVPFQSGKIEIWAAAVIHALGTVNFAFDKSFEPYTTVDEINKFFGTKKSTVGNKSKEIRELFKMSYFNNEFLTQNCIKSNPFNNLVSINGLIVSPDSLPDDIRSQLL